MKKNRYFTIVLLGTTLRFGVPAGVSATEPPCPQDAVQHAAQSVQVDRSATEEIRRRIRHDDTMSPQSKRVEVTMSEGIVTLRGPVATAEDRITVASLAESVPGVRRVDDRLQVRRQQSRD